MVNHCLCAFCLGSLSSRYLMERAFLPIWSSTGPCKSEGNWYVVTWPEAFKSQPMLCAWSPPHRPGDWHYAREYLLCLSASLRDRAVSCHQPSWDKQQRGEGQRCRCWPQADLTYPEGGTTSPVLELSDLRRWHCCHCSLTWLHSSGDSSQTAGQNPGHAPSCPFTPLVQSISPRSLSEIWIYVWIYVVRGDERRGLWSWLLGSESTIMINRIISLWGEADLFAQIAWVQIGSCLLSSHEGFKVTWKNVTWVRSMLPALCPSLDSLIGVRMCISPSPTRKAPVLGTFYTFSRTGAACSCWLLTPRQVSLAAHISAETLSLQCHRVMWWHRPPGPIHLAKPMCLV